MCRNVTSSDLAKPDCVMRVGEDVLVSVDIQIVGPSLLDP